ncbi:MAG: glycosyltransferase family 4 protein [bacterium]
MKLRFFNTFEPVIPLFRLLLPHLERAGHEARAWIADREYRSAGLSGGLRARAIPTWSLRRRDGSPRKAFVHLSYAVGAALRSLFGRGVDCNVFLTQPPLFPIWARVLRGLRRQPYCIILMDLYPWVAVEAGVMQRSAVTTRLAEALARAALRGANRVIVIGRCMDRRVRELGVAPERVHLIQNWADTDAVRPVPRAKNRKRARLGLEGRFVVMYSGNLGVSHQFRELLEVAERLREETDLLFLIVGDGSRRKEVESQIRRRALTNVLLLPFQPYEEIGETLSMGDVHFVSLRPGFEGLVVPSKAYGVLAAGRPIIYQGSRKGEVARMVKEEEVGVVLDAGDRQGLAAAILRARDDPEWTAETGERARRVAETFYSAGAALHKYEEILTGAEAPQGESDHD